MNEKYWRGNVLVHECRNGARMNFHDTHSNIWDLPCKSQSCASLGKFCANVAPYIKIDNS